MVFGVIIALLEGFRLGVAGGVDGDVEISPGASAGRDEDSRSKLRSEIADGCMVSWKLKVRWSTEGSVSSCTHQSPLLQGWGERGGCLEEEPMDDRSPQSLEKEAGAKSCSISLEVNGTSLLPSPVESMLTYSLNISLKDWSKDGANILMALFSVCGDGRKGAVDELARVDGDW